MCSLDCRAVYFHTFIWRTLLQAATFVNFEPGMPIRQFCLSDPSHALIKVNAMNSANIHPHREEPGASFLRDTSK